MTIKIVTDSTADLPPRLAEELGITVVPVYLRFGDEVFHDRVDISADEFYRRLMHDTIHPSTTQPSPQDFIDVYKELSKKADGIISIHVTDKLSGTCNSALQGKKAVGKGCPIEVIDSQLVTMGLGQLAMAANEIAQSGKSLPQVAEEVKKMIPSIRGFGLLDTLKYLALGGRIGKVQALLGSVLSVKPMLTIKDGVLAPAGRARSRAKGIDILFDYVKNTADIQDLAVVYNTAPDEAQALVKRLGSVFPEERIRLAQLGPALGVHTGPGILFVALRGKSI
ncbi:MAG TPA: DegV family protein [Dehalococcoidales bacterium]|nr:DegV family protein [Dehalococcoidales bacterium]